MIFKYFIPGNSDANNPTAAIGKVHKNSIRQSRSPAESKQTRWKSDNEQINWKAESVPIQGCDVLPSRGNSDVTCPIVE